MQNAYEAPESAPKNTPKRTPENTHASAPKKDEGIDEGIVKAQEDGKEAEKEVGKAAGKGEAPAACRADEKPNAGRISQRLGAAFDRFLYVGCAGTMTAAAVLAAGVGLLALAGKMHGAGAAKSAPLVESFSTMPLLVIDPGEASRLIGMVYAPGASPEAAQAAVAAYLEKLAGAGIHAADARAVLTGPTGLSWTVERETRRFARLAAKAAGLPTGLVMAMESGLDSDLEAGARTNFRAADPMADPAADPATESVAHRDASAGSAGSARSARSAQAAAAEAAAAELRALEALPPPADGEALLARIERFTAILEKLEALQRSDESLRETPADCDRCAVNGGAQ